MIIRIVAFILPIIVAPSLIAFSGNHLHQCMWATFDTLNNNSERASQRYHAIKGHSVWMYHGYIPFLFKHNRYQEIIDNKDLIESTFDNPHILWLLAQSLKKVGRLQEAHERTIKLNKKHPDHPEITLNTAQIYIDRKEYTSALECLNTYLNKASHRGNAYVFHFLKAQIYNQMNNITQALASVEECLSLKSGYTQALLFRALLEQKLKETTSSPLIHQAQANNAEDGYETPKSLSQSGNLQAKSNEKLALKDSLLEDIHSPCHTKCCSNFTIKTTPGIFKKKI